MMLSTKRFALASLLLCLSHLVGCDYGLITISDKNMVTIRFEVPENFPGVPYVSSHWSSDSFLCRNISFTTGDRDAPAKFGKSVSAEKIDGSWVVTFPTELEHPLCSWSLDMNTIGIEYFDDQNQYDQLAWLHLRDGVSENGWDKDVIVCDQNISIIFNEQNRSKQNYESFNCRRTEGSDTSGLAKPITILYIDQKNSMLHIKYSGKVIRSYRMVKTDTAFSKKVFLLNGSLTKISVMLGAKKHWDVILKQSEQFNILYYEAYGVPPVVNATLPLTDEQLKILSADDQWELPDFITGKQGEV